jgi:beta-barrel assembly-enhancing protease
MLIILIITACASTSSVTSYENTLKKGYAPLDEEVWANEQSDKFQQELVSRGLVYRDEQIQQYVTTLKNQLLSKEPEASSSIQVYVLRAPEANAFALPNGVIFLHSGLFTGLESQAQLSAIIAHEIAHVTQRHSVKQVISNKSTMITAHIADLATGGFGLAYFPAIASIMSYSRGLESEADQVGLRRLKRAGYSPNAMREVFETFQKLPEMKHVKNSIYSSHPSQAKRIEELNALVGENTVSPTAGDDLNNKMFLSLKTKMMEDNLNMRLQARQFYLAQTIVDQAQIYYKGDHIISFYQGEIYRGLYLHPDDAAKEKYWLETGKHRDNNKYVAELAEAKDTHLNQAKTAYQQSLRADEPILLAYKRLGELHKESGNKIKAAEAYQQYLDLSDQPKDRRFVERVLQRLKL